MLDIINVYEVTNGELLEKTNVLKNEEMFFIHRGDFFDNPPRSYFGIDTLKFGYG